MKSMNFLFACVFAALFVTLYSFKPLPAASDKSSGTLGDVKYSVLGPKAFAKENGNGWVILEGQKIDGTGTELKESKLFKEYHIRILPDVRGVFIRCQNLQRDAKTGDPDGDRDITKLQPDLIRRHSHSIPTVNGNTDDGGGIFNSRGNKKRNITLSDSTGGAETRPKNIALFTYVKIN